MIYVTATDSFLSGWGMAEGKVNKLVIEVTDHATAEKVCEKLKNRGDMRFISISNNKPSYDANKVYVSYYNINNDTWTKSKEVTK